jgi:hypothetical protein
MPKHARAYVLRVTPAKHIGVRLIRYSLMVLVAVLSSEVDQDHVRFFLSDPFLISRSSGVVVPRICLLISFGECEYQFFSACGCPAETVH